MFIYFTMWAGVIIVHTVMHNSVEDYHNFMKQNQKHSTRFKKEIINKGLIMNRKKRTVKINNF